MYDDCMYAGDVLHGRDLRAAVLKPLVYVLEEVQVVPYLRIFLIFFGCLSA